MTHCVIREAFCTALIDDFYTKTYKTDITLKFNVGFINTGDYRGGLGPLGQKK